MKPGAAATLVALALALAPPRSPAQVQEVPLELPDYVARLQDVSELLAARRLDEARRAAHALAAASLLWEGDTLAADRVVLDAVAAARDEAEAARAARPLARLLQALRAPGLATPIANARKDLLAQVEPRDELRKGGTVDTLRVRPLPQRVVAWLASFADWISDLVRRLVEWLARLKPRREPVAGTPGRTALAALAFAVGVALLLGLLAWRARRARPAPTAEAEPESASERLRDADPLSRGATEWERRAAELAAARRFREAIRAWYHAVLVALFGAGLLRHQKGRTNWEYVERLAPELAFRSSFVALTRLFEREWYGRRASEADALADCTRTASAILRSVRETEAT